MNFSILDSYYKFSFGNDCKNSFICWNDSFSIGLIFSEYIKEYNPKNDFLIFEESFFKRLAYYFKDARFTFENISFSSFLNNLQIYIYNIRTSFYLKKTNEEIETIFSSISNSNVDLLINNNKIDFLAKNDLNFIDIKANDFIKNNPQFFEEFKCFLSGFYSYIIDTNNTSYKNFNYVYQILLDDMLFFKKTEFKSLLKYDFIIGFESLSRGEANRKISSFVPAGTCYYGEKIFINSSLLRSDKLWTKKSLKTTFYHEIGHSLDRLYFNETIFKNKKFTGINSHNFDLLDIVVHNYRKTKILKRFMSKSKKEYKYYSYFISPIEESLLSKSQSHDSASQFKNFFIENTPVINKPFYNKKIFSPKLIKGNKELNFSRSLKETWAESFAILFDWLKNGFDVYDLYVLNSGYSKRRVLIKILGDSILYLLENIDWEKLNIRQSIYLKRKVSIKNLIKHIQFMPINLHVKVYRPITNKKFTDYNNLLKHI